MTPLWQTEDRGGEWVHQVTHFVEAASKGDTEKVLFLLEEGLPIDASNAIGETALLAACFAGRTEMTKLLLESGADPNQPAQSGNPVIFEVLSGKVEILRLLIEAGANLNVRGTHKLTPLHSAVAEGLSEVVELLLTAGANPNSAADHGERPLHIAASKGRVDIAHSLLDHGADVNPENVEKVTPLVYARNERDPAMIDLLKQRLPWWKRFLA